MNVTHATERATQPAHVSVVLSWKTCLSWQDGNHKSPTLTDHHWSGLQLQTIIVRLSMPKHVAHTQWKFTQSDWASGQHATTSNTVPFQAHICPFKYRYGPIKLRYANRLMTSNYWQTCQTEITQHYQLEITHTQIASMFHSEYLTTMQWSSHTNRQRQATQSHSYTSAFFIKYSILFTFKYGHAALVCFK